MPASFRRRLRSEQSPPHFVRLHARDFHDLVPRFFPGQERDVASVEPQFFRDEFQQRLVGFSLHRGCGDFHFHCAAVFAGHLIPLRIGDNAELQRAQRQGFTYTPMRGRFEGVVVVKSLTNPVFVRISTWPAPFPP